MQTFEEFWKSLTSIQRVILATLYQTGLSERSGGFHKSTVIQTLLLIHQISSMDSFGEQESPNEKADDFGGYLKVVFGEAKNRATTPSDQFEQVCLILKNHIAIANRKATGSMGGVGL
jgi:hypothetical protein